MTDFSILRKALAKLPTDHDASGAHRPTVSEIFTPDQHANALDANTPVVVGARGAGKSFWAGVLEQDETREATANAYPNLGLDRLIVRPGYSGFSGEDLVSPQVIDARVPRGSESQKAIELWQAVIMRAAKSALEPDAEAQSIRSLMERYEDPEDAAGELRALDKKFTEQGRTLLVTFDALDTLSRDWVRSSLLIDALLEVVWGMRARRSIRAKIFIRPEQLNDESLRFVELPKLRSDRVELEWSQADLYGLLYWRLSSTEDAHVVASFQELAAAVGSAFPPEGFQRRRHWPLLNDTSLQKRLMDQMAGLYMGKGNKKGGTYDWPYKHLADSAGRVTPRSFLKLFVEAAKFGQAPVHQVITPEGIRHGLREASKVRVDQLGIEYKWVSRALAPLAGVTVPCEPEAIYSRWRESNTVNVILEAANDELQGFLPPFPIHRKGDQLEMLAGAMGRIGMLSYREDGRVDIPDLFRVAALMLKKGGTPPKQRR